MRQCVFGFDFGTLSCRGVALDLADGRLLAEAEKEYEHGVISRQMYHNGRALPSEWFLQDPDDWLASMEYVSKALLLKGEIAPEEVVGIGTDFTSCTLLPVTEDGTPLCSLEKFRDIPNAWPKLWKHHGAQSYAEEIEAYAKNHTHWLKQYFGNSVSSEWVFPKALQVARENPEVYQAAAYFIEAVDWIPYILTGNLTRNAGILGVNAFWVKGQGYPGQAFCKGLDPLLADFPETKLAGKIVTAGDAVGFLNETMSRRLGLTTAAAVAAGHGDSAVVGCGTGVSQSGSMLLVMGTSTCHQLLYEDFVPVDGLCSIAADGMLPGLYSYEAGQPATGDVFQWFADTCVPEAYSRKAREKKQSVLEFLGEKAAQQKPGGSGLLALDWLNGNRSILSDYHLSGMVLGLTLSTKPEEIYRAFVEANLFGSRVIMENYKEHGIRIQSVYAVGGIAAKSPWIMQLCADILNRRIRVPRTGNIPARGAAACGAVAAGGVCKELGYESFADTAQRLIAKDYMEYIPDSESVEIYDRLYGYYKKLHDLFGSGSIMKELKTVAKNEQKVFPESL